MSINEIVPCRADYTSTGSGTDYAFNWEIYNQSHLAVYKAGSLQTLNVDYRVRNGVLPFTSLTASQLPASGFIQFIDGGGSPTTLAAGINVVLLRAQPYEQQSNYTGEALPSSRIEQDYDKLAMQTQQLEEISRRAVRARPNELLDMVLPSVASRASNVLGFTAAGLPTAVPLPTAGGGDLSLSTVLSTGSTTARTMAERFAEVFNVKDYGAVGNGVTDDSAAVQAAMTAGAGLTVYIPDGTFIVKNISVSANTHITGTGTLKLKALASLDLSPILDVNGSGVEIDGITLDGNKANQPADGFSDSYDTGTNSTGRAARAAIWADGVYTGLNVHDVTIQNTWGGGVVARDVSEITIERVTARDCNFEFAYLGGSVANGDVNELNVSNNRFDTLASGHGSVNANAIVISYANRVKVNNNLGYNVERNFVKLTDVLTAQVDGNTFDTNTVVTFGAIQTQGDATDVSITNNTIRNTQSGITSNATTGNTITIANNTVRTVSGASQADGIAVIGTLSNLHIQNNTLTDILRYGIYLTVTAVTGAKIDHNLVYGQGDNGSIGIHLKTAGASTDVQVIGNYVNNFVELTNSNGTMTIDRSSSGTWANLVVEHNMFMAGASTNRAFHILTANNIVTSGSFSHNYFDGLVNSGFTAQGWAIGPNQSTGAFAHVGGTTWGLLSAGVKLTIGTGSPESAVTAPIGSLFIRTDGGAATSLYVKESGTGNTGWVGK